MAEQNGRYEIELKVLNSGTVVAKVKDLIKNFELLDDAISIINEDLKQQQVLGTSDYYNEQIALTRKLRDSVADTSEEYKKYNAAIKELTEKRDALNAPMEGTLAFYNQEIQKLREEQAQLADNADEWARYESQIAAHKMSVDRLTNSQSLNTRSNKNMISNAGLAGATVTELGRTISDANYGIRGMANNLSQLSTLFITLVSKTGGAKDAISLLVEQMRGPLGYILVFQAAVTALEYFSANQEKAKKTIEDTSDAIKNQLGVLDSLMNMFETNEGFFERYDIIQAIATIDKDLAESLQNNIFNEEKLNEIKKARRRLTEANLNLEVKGKDLSDKINKNALEAKKLQDTVDEEERLQWQYRLSGQQISQDWLDETQALKDKINLLDKDNNKLIAEQQPLLTERTEAEKAYKALVEKKNKDEIDHSEIVQELTDQLNLSKLKGFDQEREQAEISRRETLARIDEELKAKEISEDEARKARILAEKIHSQELMRIKEEELKAFRDAEEKYDKATEKSRRDFEKRKENESDKALDNIKDFITEEKIARNSAVRDEIKGKEARNKEYERINKELIDEEIKLIELAIQAGVVLPEAGLAAIRKLKAIASTMGGQEEDQEMTPEEKLKQVQTALNAVEQASQAIFDAEISREERKTMLMNNQLRDRLNNEKLSAKEREAINDQIARNDEELQKKRDKVAEKAFKVQKAFNMISVLMDTYRNGWLAYGSQLVIGDPTSALRAKIAQGLTLAAGFAQVAAIASQKFVPSATTIRGGSEGGSSSGPAIQAPDFNIVGSSGINQLSEALQAQSDKPVKAYVVSKDISTAQELDRNKVLSSGL